MNSNDKIRLLYIDLFCGAGGTSTRVHLARHSGRERSLPEGLAEGVARETGLYLLGIERRAAGRSLLR